MAGIVSIYLVVPKGKALLCKARLLTTPGELSSGIIGQPANFVPCFFVFPKTSRWRNSIHSFFCPPFAAFFLNEKLEVVDVGIVQPFNPLVVPSEKSKFLLEAPLSFARKLAKGSRLLVKPLKNARMKSDGL